MVKNTLMTMKNLIYSIFIIFSIVSCSIDNYEAPNATLSGKVVDSETGEMIQNGGPNGGTVIQLYEGNSLQPILSNSYPDGHFTNAALFPGNYKLVAVGAFEMVQDTVNVKLSENTEVEIEVIPNVRLSAAITGSDATTATVKVNYSKVHADQTLEQIAVVWSTIDNPNLYTFFGGDQIIENVGADDLTSGEKTFTITGLESGTTYYVRAGARTDAPGNYYNYSTTITHQ